MLENIQESHHKPKHFQAQSIFSIVFASLTIILNILILKAYNKNDKFEKGFRDLQIKHSNTFLKDCVEETIKVFLEKSNDSNQTETENMAKKEEKEPSFVSEQNKHNDFGPAFGLEIVKKEQKIDFEQKNIQYDIQPLQRLESCISPAYNYIKPDGLEEEQDQEYNSSLILMMTNTKQWTWFILNYDLLVLQSIWKSPRQHIYWELKYSFTM